MKLKKIDTTDSDQLYKQNNWLNCYGKKLSLIGIFNENDEVMGSFTVQKDSIKGMKAIFTPVFQSNSALEYKSATQKPSTRISNEKKLFESIANYLKDSKAKIVDISFPSAFSDMQAFQWAGFEVKPKYTYIIDLSYSEKDLLSNLDTSTRSNLKKAQKELKVRIEHNAPESLRLCDLTFSRQEKSYHRAMLKRILENNQLVENRKSFFVSDGSQNIAVVEMVFDKNTAYYLIGGYDSNSKHRGASTLAMWTAINEMKKYNVKSFDFQGSMIPAVEKFVRGFGGKKNTYFSVQKMPWYYKLGKTLFKR